MSPYCGTPCCSVHTIIMMSTTFEFCSSVLMLSIKQSFSSFYHKKTQAVCRQCGYQIADKKIIKLCYAHHLTFRLGPIHWRWDLSLKIGDYIMNQVCRYPQKNCYISKFLQTRHLKSINLPNRPLDVQIPTDPETITISFLYDFSCRTNGSRNGRNTEIGQELQFVSKLGFVGFESSIDGIGSTESDPDDTATADDQLRHNINY